MTHWTALEHRDFTLLWSGQTVSLLGNGIFTVALPLAVLRLTNSSLDLAVVVSSRTIATVLMLLIGGTLVDRIPRRLVMLACDCTCGVAVAAVSILLAGGHASLWELAALSAVFGVANAFFLPASTAIAADILPEEALVSGSSLTSLGQSLSLFLLGPVAGGLIVAFIGTSWAFAIDAATFGISAVTLSLMQSRPQSTGNDSHLLREMAEGLRYCRSLPWLWWSMIAVGITNFVCFSPINIIEPLLVRNIFHKGAVPLGLLYAAGGAGGAVAALAASRAPKAWQLGAIWTAWGGAGLAATLMGIAPWWWLAAVLAGIAWFAVTFGNILWFPLLQRQVPKNLLGRVSSIDWILSLALAPMGILAAGATAGIVGVRLTLVLGGLISALTGAVILTWFERGARYRGTIATRSES